MSLRGTAENPSWIFCDARLIVWNVNIKQFRVKVKFTDTSCRQFYPKKGQDCSRERQSTAIIPITLWIIAGKYIVIEKYIFKSGLINIFIHRRRQIIYEERPAPQAKRPSFKSSWFGLSLVAVCKPSVRAVLRQVQTQPDRVKSRVRHVTLMLHRCYIMM